MSARLPTAYHVATMAPYLSFRYPLSMLIPIVTIGEVVTTLHSPIAVVVGSLSNFLLSLAALLRGRKTLRRCCVAAGPLQLCCVAAGAEEG